MINPRIYTTLSKEPFQLSYIIYTFHGRPQLLTQEAKHLKRSAFSSFAKQTGYRTILAAVMAGGPFGRRPKPRPRRSKDREFDHMVTFSSYESEPRYA